MRVGPVGRIAIIIGALFLIAAGTSQLNITDSSLTGNGSTSNPLKVVTSVIQKRVTGTCADPNGISTINTDGSVVCTTTNLGGAGSTGRLPRYAGLYTLGNSAVSDDLTTFSVNGVFSVTESSGNTSIGGTETVTGAATLNNGVTVNVGSTQNGYVVKPTVIAPAQLTGTRKDNYAPTDVVSGHTLGTGSVLSQDATAATTITGFDATGIPTGFEFEFHNISSFAITFTHADTNSLLLNRMALAGISSPGATWKINPGGNALLRYNGSGWRVMYIVTTDFPGLTVGGNTIVTNSYAGITHYEWATDHMFVPQSATASDSIFNCTFVGAGAGFSNVGSPGRLGVIGAASGTTATGRVNCHTSSSVAMSILNVATQQSVIGIPTLDDGVDKYQLWSGFFSTDSAVDQVAGCYFLYDHNRVATAPGTGTVTTGDHLQCWCALASTRTGYDMNGTQVSDNGFTTVNTALGARTWPSTNILNLIVVFTVGVKAEFYVNGVKSCEIASNLPSTTSTTAGWAFLKSAGTNSRSMEVDYTRLAVDQSAVRASP